MVLCKFFQQGSCRYGQNCRFDHIYGSKYSYHANAQSEPTPQTAPAVTDEQLVNQVQSDLLSMLRGGQWLLSYYAPFKEKPAFPGLTNMSPEEARLFIYEARANNTLEQAMATMNGVFLQAKQKYEILLQKNVNITSVFRKLYNGENVTSPFENQLKPVASAFGGNEAAASVFRSALQPTQPSFSQNSPSGFGSNTFTNDPAKSIFAQASQNIFQQNQQGSSIFSATNVSQPFVQDNAQSIFAQATQNYDKNTPQNVFTQNSQQNVFNTQNAQNTASSIFASANAAQSLFANLNQNQSEPAAFQSTNVFQKPVGQPNPSQSVFGANTYQNVKEDHGIYSKMEDISPEDIEAFNSDDFKMGFIPELPPPHSLCV